MLIKNYETKKINIKIDLIVILIFEQIQKIVQINFGLKN